MPLYRKQVVRTALPRMGSSHLLLVFACYAIGSVVAQIEILRYTL